MKKETVKKETKTKKPVKQKKEKPIKPKAKSTKKTKETKKIQKKIETKNKPVFRGHFGKRGSSRKIKKDKWNKWRKPRGIDYIQKKDDGAVPKIGYRTPKMFRGIHPSGLKEINIRNEKELEKIKEGNAVRIYSKTGKKKRKLITKKAMEKGIKVLNR
jgi:ribosomal protein L32E